MNSIPKFLRRIRMKLKVGQKAPNFTLSSHLDKKVTLRKCLGKGPVVIAFFPLAWTPV
jgi:peroxiredoxin